jgi:hypothetical protein
LFDVSAQRIAWNGTFWTGIGKSTANNGSYNMATSIDGIRWNMINNTSFNNETLTSMYANPKIPTTFITSYTLAAPPTNLAVTGSTGTTISISFTPPTTPVTTYTVTAVPTSGTTVTQTFNAPATTYTITGLQEATIYTITMVSTNIIETSSSSTSVNRTTTNSFIINRMSNSGSLVAAYGFKRYSLSYTGATVNIRRSTDNVTSDFYANSTGALGTSLGATGTSLSSWLGAATGFVTTWYDQSGRSKHLSQATTTSQPTIGSDANGYFAYFNNKILSGGNVFDTTTITNAHVVFATKEISRLQNALISLNGNDFTAGSRMTVTTPWADGTWFMDYGDITTVNRANTPANTTTIGARTVFSGYKALVVAFRLNGGGTRYTSGGSTSASVAGGVIIGTVSTASSDHNVYGLIICNAQLGTADETLLESNI